MKRALIWITTVLFLLPFTATAEEVRIPPAFKVPDYVRWLIETAEKELGYTEDDHGYTKYGEWAGDPYAQWCAEFLCWCVNQVDEQYGTQLLRHVYPYYSSSNVGRSFFIERGRYIVRWGNLEGWGYQWLKNEDHFLTTGSYIPQPGDWVFLTWTNDENTDHVAMVEYCTRNTATGKVTIHVIEGNTPSSVRHERYDLEYKRILGFGTVHDCADWTLRIGNTGEKVRQLQEKLYRIGLLKQERVDGRFGASTQNAVKTFQSEHGLKVNGIANISTQTELNRMYRSILNADPETWIVQDGDDDDWSLDDFSITLPSASQEKEGEKELNLIQNEDVENILESLEDSVPDWVLPGSD